MYIILFLSILFTEILLAHNLGNNFALVVKPVVDGCWFSLDNLGIFSSCEQHYRQLPYSEEKGKFSCPRSHQLLFNEFVKITEEHAHEYKCELINIFYYDKARPCRDIWLLKKDVIKAADLRKKKVDLRAIPVPYIKNKKRSERHILTLIWPWHDQITGNSYSAGTRFVREKKQDTLEYFAIKIFDVRDFRAKISFVPRSVALVDYPEKKEDCLKLFLDILKKWANNKEFIPYVYGGCSFINTCTDHDFELKTLDCLGKQEEYWDRKREKQAVVSGIECSSLIFRIAQIVGMPYFYKNSVTLVRYLEPLRVQDELKNGDLIWYPGHVLVVSNIAENKVIESAGYRVGFGRLHETTLDRIFEGVSSYTDLITAYRTEKPIYRITNSGQRIKFINKFRLLKLSSIWK